MRSLKTLQWVYLSALAFCLFACGGSSSKSSNTNTGGSRAVPSGVSTSAGTLTTYTAPTKVSGSGKRLMAVYMVGSDLESQSLAGTNDFNEMVAGYNALSSAEKDTFDLVVAFGGANKTGWKGMKIATMSQIVVDSADGVYGNETATGSYQYQADAAHMGDKTSLELFLAYLTDGYGDHEIKFLTFWDHGTTYSGFGNDENYNNDPLYLSEIDTAFKNKNSPKFSLIGFDACLQASIETARFMKTYSDYLVASEELEPGHGWEWSTVVKKFVQTDFGNNSNPSSTIESIGKAMCDNFVLDVHNYTSSGKTLSLVKMSKFSDLETKLNAVLDDYTSNMSTQEYSLGVLNATTKAQAYGKNEKENTKNAVDIKDFAVKLKETTTSSALKTKLNELIVAVGLYVVHSRNDGANPRSYGVAFCPPEDTLQPNLDAEKINQNFLTFQKAYVQKKSLDVVAPAVVSGSTNTSASASSYNFNSTADDLSAAIKGKSVVLKYKDTTKTDKYHVIFLDGSKVKGYWESVGNTSAGQGAWQLSKLDVNLFLSGSSAILELATTSVSVGTAINLYEYPKGTTSATAKEMEVETIGDSSKPAVKPDGGSSTSVTSVQTTTVTFASGVSIVLTSDGKASGSFAGETFTSGTYTLYGDGLALYFDSTSSVFIETPSSLEAGVTITHYTFDKNGSITSGELTDVISSISTSGASQKKSKEEENVAPFLKGERAAFVSLTDDKKGKVDSNVSGTVTIFTEENLKSINTVYGFIEVPTGETDSYLMSIAELEAYATQNVGEYFTPKWNQNWYTVKYTSDTSKLTQWMPMIFAGKTTRNGKEFVKYHAEIDYYDSEKTYSGETKYDLAILEIVVNESNTVVEHQVTSYQVFFEDEDDTVGRIQYSKVKKQLKSGDKVQFYQYGFNLNDETKDTWFDASDVITFDTSPEFKVELLEF